MSVLITTAVTMTSLELVGFINEHRKDQAEQAGQSFPSEAFPELTHANLLAKVPKVLGETSHSFECDLPDSYGRHRRGYRFPKREACLIAMSYSYDLQAAVFDRMTALEEAQRTAVPAIPQTLPEALRLAADLAEQNGQLQQVLAEQAPKVEALDRIATADGSLCITNAAKDLQLRPKDLFAWLQSHQWIYRRAGSSGWLAYQIRIQQGLLEHKVTTVSRSDGSEKVVEQVLVTAKGLAKLAAEASANTL
ncbi:MULTISPECIES: phage antirepressor KilAC domain-containing protein [unclassified Pseudomonas]|uniref:phage antirepressor KilAC domain-containing protein n=1 Tax=unclassified Pseudomonas TaxID=196821 RepID=UPI002448EDB6|nr:MULTISPECIES: phage antirepressor KilAC domain-containing protein [unclassified Pseudomonas]MDG9927397.1 phage antirepressor KilAC domain-containing protein [Pseudomonas sp. GD04042]MDH0482466.1 phage antirepressor KilAC domain-containing protein [Pseudomonas sp. GD04015]MDH0602818.1 phage antirepressor KilAC domain-containing protein [Pseudomonas sp. GD03869]